MNTQYVSPTMKYTGMGQTGTIKPQCCDVGVGAMAVVLVVVWDAAAIVNVAAGGIAFFKGIGPSC